MKQGSHIANIPLRFFAYDWDESEDFLVETEITPEVFMELAQEMPESISYQRHTIFSNGVNQICLTVGGSSPYE